MRIAVASSGLNVATRFERAESYTIYRVERGIIVECQNIPVPIIPYVEIASQLVSIDVSVIIVGAIPVNIARVFCQASIEVVAGAQGSAREVVEQYLTRTLIGVDEMCRDDDYALDGVDSSAHGCTL